MSVATHTNPTKIVRMQGPNWFRFNISTPEKYTSGFFNESDLESKSTLPKPLKLIGKELTLVDAVEKFHINLGGDKSDRIVVKFKDHEEVTEGMLVMIADFIGEMLG